MAKTFTVPQFIDVESKIIGSLTVRQFLICLTGIIIMFISYRLFSFMIFVTISVFCFAIFGSFAFMKINGRPFHYFVLNFIQTSKKPALRVWNHRNKDKDFQEAKVDKTAKDKEFIPSKGKLSSSRLNELSLVVDTKGVYKADE